jgi:hypothetical protein
MIRFFIISLTILFLVSCRQNKTTFLEEKIQSPVDTISIQKRIEQSEFEIDFKAIKAFSIERSLENGQAITIIGYKDKDDNDKEWNFTCSEEKHKQLAEQFRKDILNR